VNFRLGQIPLKRGHLPQITKVGGRYSRNQASQGWITGNIGAAIVEQIELNIFFAGLAQEGELVCPPVGIQRSPDLDSSNFFLSVPRGAAPNLI